MIQKLDRLVENFPVLVYFPFVRRSLFVDVDVGSQGVEALTFAVIDAAIDFLVSGVDVKSSGGNLLDTIGFCGVGVNLSVSVLFWDEMLEMLDEIGVGETGVIKKLTKIKMFSVPKVDLDKGGGVVESEVEAIKDFVDGIGDLLDESEGGVDDVGESAVLSFGVDLKSVGVLLLESFKNANIFIVEEWIVPVGGVDEFDFTGEVGSENNFLVDPTFLFRRVEGHDKLVGDFLLEVVLGRGETSLKNEKIVPLKLRSLLHPNVRPLRRFDFLGVVDTEEGHEASRPRAGEGVGDFVVVEAGINFIFLRQVENHLVRSETEGRECFSTHKNFPSVKPNQSLKKKLGDGMRFRRTRPADVDKVTFVTFDVSFVYVRDPDLERPRLRRVLS